MNKKIFWKALVFIEIFFFCFFLNKSIFAIPAEYQRCKTGDICVVGEFLYDDEYNPIATASCHLTSRYPNGSLFINSATMSAETDGWYSYSFDTANQPEGLYRSQICCSVDNEYLCLDKTFVIGPSYLTATEAAEAVWNAPVSSHNNEGTFGKNLQNPVLTAQQIWEYTNRTLTGFGDLVAQIWNYTSRTLTDFGSLIASIWSHPTRTLTSQNLDNGKKLATEEKVNEIVKTATKEAVAEIKGPSGKNLTNLSSEIAEVKTKVDQIDTKTNGINTLLTKWGSYSASDIYDKVKNLSSEISSINSLSSDDISEILRITRSNQNDLKTLLNKVLAMESILAVNKKLLEGLTTEPIIKVWLEEGSIVFKVMITNPSYSDKKIVPFKYYLPKEVKRENILKFDEVFEVKYDPKEDSYYIQAEIALAPKETKIYSVEVEDVWKIDKSTIGSLRQQAKTLFEPLKKTAYFAQAATLKSDIDMNLDKAWMLVQNAYTPESRIKAYREAQIEINQAKTKINDLKVLLANASSSTSLFASLTNVQTLAVFGLVVIIVAGFVFLLWYFKKTEKKETELEKEKIIIEEKNILRKNKLEKLLHHPHAKIFHLFLIFSGGLILGLLLSVKKSTYISIKSELAPIPTISVVVDKRQLSGFITPEASPMKEATISAKNSTSEVLGEKNSTDRVLVSVPLGVKINLRSLPTLKGEVLYQFDKDTEAKIIEKVEGWVKVEFNLATNSAKITGWVTEDFVRQ